MRLRTIRFRPVSYDRLPFRCRVFEEVRAVYTFAHQFHIDFGKVKVGNDVSLVIIAAIVSLASLGTIEGIREGTLLSALLTGIFARFFLRHLSRVDAHGRIYLSLH